MGALVALLSTAACGGTPNAGGGGLSFVGQAQPPGPPAHVVGGFKIQVPPVQVAAGSEVFPCYVFPLDLTGTSRFVGGAKLTPGGQGLHHGNITLRPHDPSQPNMVRPCPTSQDVGGGAAGDLIKGGGWLYASSTQVKDVEWQTFPDGDAFKINPSFEIVAYLHYLNTTPNTLTVAPTYEWFTIDEGTVVNRLNPFGFVRSQFQIPPNSTTTAGSTCGLPKPFHIVSLLPHMHKLGREFIAEFSGGQYDGTRFLDNDGYDPDKGVRVVYEPPVDLSVAPAIHFSCTWQNTFDKTIVEGTGDNEMCMLFGYGYPYDQTYAGFAASEDSCAVVGVPSTD